MSEQNFVTAREFADLRRQFENACHRWLSHQAFEREETRSIREAIEKLEADVPDAVSLQIEVGQHGEAIQVLRAAVEKICASIDTLCGLINAVSAAVSASPAGFASPARAAARPAPKTRKRGAHATATN